jgi:uncharacterized membrane protein
MSELNRTSEIIVLVTALGCGLMAGVFFAFSGFVMAGLDRLAPGQAVAAMQGINVTAVRPPLMIALFGTALGCLAVAVIAVRNTDGNVRTLLLAGALVYLVGAVVVTAAYNVPLNNTLDALDAATASKNDWQHYLTRWTAGNHVRTVASLAGAGCLTWALRLA